MMTPLQTTFKKIGIRPQFVALVVILAAASAIGNKAQSAVPYGPERSLVGIRIYSPASAVLKKFGNPSDIITGSANVDTSANTTGGGGAGRVGPMPTPPPGNEFSGGGTNGGGASSAGTNTQAVNEVTYRYSNKNGNKMDFRLSPDGRVIQITASGFKSPTVMTARKITLGSSYLDVINKYGYPESQSNTNGIITTKYTDRAHVAFQMFQNKVISITVAAVE